MFLLTEGTLFFLDLTLDARTCGEKPSLRSAVRKWVDEVAAANDSDDSADGVHTTTGTSSTLFAPPPPHLSATVGGQTSCTTSGCGESVSTPRSAAARVSSMIAFSVDGHDAGEIATSHYSRDSASTYGMNSIGNSGSGRCNPHVDASLFPQYQVRGSVKRKLEDVDMVYDIDPPQEGDGRFMMISTSVKSPISQPQKKVKCADASVSFRYPPQDPSLGRIPAISIANPQAPQRRQADNEDYIIGVIKKPSEYTSGDLPVPCDQRWSQSFISTAILWYSVQKNIWNVPESVLARALQRIFDVVYPDVNYRINPAGAVFVLTLQRIYEWQSSFGSSALAMMLHFFSALDNADDIHAAAEFLATDFRFLRADPDACEQTERFRSPFLLILLAITHLGDIAACVEVPGWDTRRMAAGEGGEGVIAIASAALERALTLFRNGTLDAEHVLAETARVRCQNAKLPDMVLDALAGHDAPPALRFSSANWSGHTTAYRDAVRKRGAAFVRATFDAAREKRRKIVGVCDEDGMAGESEAGLRASERMSVVPDPRALL